MDERVNRTDVAILGGGPAGLAAALALRQRGCRVAVYDAQRPPIDKACGEGLMPEAVRLLRGLGVALDERDGASFSRHLLPRCALQRIRRIQRRQRTGACAARACRDAWQHGRRRWASRCTGEPSVRALAGGGFAAAGAPIDADFFVIADGFARRLRRRAGSANALLQHALREPAAVSMRAMERHW